MKNRSSFILSAVVLVALVAVPGSARSELLELDSQTRDGEEIARVENSLASFLRVGNPARDYRSSRNLGRVRGVHPYALLIDEIAPEKDRRLYTWSIPLPDYADIHGMDWLRDGPELKADIVLYDTRDLVTHSNGRKSLKREAELVLVRVLECPTEEPGENYANRLHKPVTPGAIETWPAANAAGRTRRLVIPCASPDPKLKLMFFTFKQGEPLPRTSLHRNGKKLVVDWHDQRDVYLFETGEGRVTEFVLQRVKGSVANDTYLAFGLPVPEAGAAPGRLIGHWSFDDLRGGVAKDLSASGNDAALTGFQVVPGVQGNSLRMDGSGQIEINPQLPRQMMNGGTVAFWWRPEGERIPNASIFEPRVHLMQGFAMDYYAGGIRLKGAGDYFLGFTGRYMSRKWRHVVATFDNGSGVVAYYLNGALVSEKETTRPIDLSPCSALTVARGYKGDLDELRVYDYALPEGDVADLFAREKCYPVAHWGFDEMPRGHELRSDAGYTGMGDSVKLVPGVKGSALSFAGGGKATLPAGVVTENFNGDITVSMWFKADDETMAGNSGLFTFNEHLRNGLQCGFYAKGVRLSGAGDYHMGFSRDVRLGEWNHLVCMFDGLNAKMFLNGKQVSEKKIFGQFSLSRELTIGDNLGRFPGEIDEVRVFSYSLPGDEVARLYEAR